MNTPDTNPAIPTAAQLAESRSRQWHQQGEALLTIENLRSWINAAGLVLFSPRPQIASPAPSLVEAVLGEANPTPTLAQTAEARSLLARMVAEGLAVPLNLLGGTRPSMSGSVGETPDFVASTAVFPYIFTLRGDKTWKQPPVTSGALKVSQLALATYEALGTRGPLSAYDLATELGKEVTEAAVLRALGELWTHLRALPLAQPDGRPTLWELASARFTKQIKAGANAGQPSALSALISLYLGQAIVASEEEIESFLSPLAARSRVRDVLHALLAARQLETIAIEGRTMLHVTGELPAFLAPAAAVSEIAVSADVPSEGSTEVESTGDPESRITKHVPKPRKLGTGYLAKASPAKFAGKPFGTRAGGPRPAARPFLKPGSNARPGPPADRERRPFRKPAGPAFDKPWEEDKSRRLTAMSRPSEAGESPADFAAGTSDAADSGTPTPRAPLVFKPRADREARGGKPPFGSKPSFGSKPGFGAKPAFGSKPAFGRKPFTAKPGPGSDARPPRRNFASGPEGQTGETRPPRKTFSKPGTFARKREGFGGKPSFDRGTSDRRPPFSADSRPPRRDFSPRARQGDQDSSGPRTPRERFTPTESGKRVYRKFDAPRPRPDRADRPDGPGRPAKPARAEGQARPDRPRRDDARPARPARSFGDRPSVPRAEYGSGKPKNASSKPKPFAGRSPGDFAPRRPSGKPGAGSAAKKTFRKSSPSGFADKPGSPFAKFADGNKPFGKRPPARKFKPEGDASA